MVRRLFVAAVISAIAMIVIPLLFIFLGAITAIIVGLPATSFGLGQGVAIVVLMVCIAGLVFWISEGCLKG